MPAGHISVTKADFESALRLVKKLIPMLQRKGKNAVISYLALKILAFDLEGDFGISMNAEEEQEIKALIESLDSNGE